MKRLFKTLAVLLAFGFVVGACLASCSVTCGDCNGTGKCQFCNGSGCPNCGDSGKCTSCHGDGKL